MSALRPEEVVGAGRRRPGQALGQRHPHVHRGLGRLGLEPLGAEHRQHGIAPLLEAIAIPMLVAHGREDRLVTCAASELIASRISGAQLYLFDGKAHNPMFSATDEFCHVLRNFVRTGWANSGMRV